MKIKNIFKLLIPAVSCLLLLSACNKSPKKADTDISGEWTMVSSDGMDMDEVSVYLSFTQTKEFDLYQKLGEGRYRHYSGTYNLTDNILSGTYKDGSKFADSYLITLEADKTVLIMKSQNGAGLESRYEKSTIPSEVKSESLDVKSSISDNKPLL